jgi:hypothetical protein
MANYYATARTNYFKVVDEEEFKSFFSNLPVDIITKNSENTGELLYGLLSTCESGGWPSYIFDDETGDEEEIDIVDEIGRRLTPGHVAIIQEIGAEKLRYLVGFSVAVNSELERVSVSIDDIYSKSLSLGNAITHAEY